MSESVSLEFDVDFLHNLSMNDGTGVVNDDEMGYASSTDSRLELNPHSSIDQPSTEKSMKVQPSCYHNAQNLPPCRVCGNIASGFHYGVNSCEACKGFFRRSVARTKPYPKCPSNGNCEINLTNRNTCSECRFRKCLDVGMSKSAIKTGRYSYEKRTQDTKEVKGLHNKPIIPQQLSDKHERILMDIVQAYEECFPDSACCVRYIDNHKLRLEHFLLENNMEKVNRILHSPGHKESDTFDKSLKQNIGAFEYLLDGYMLGSNEALLNDPLYATSSKEAFEIWSIRIDKFIRSVVRFTKTVPGFTSLAMSDQIVLIKATQADLFSLQMHKAFDLEKQCLLDYRTETGDFWVVPLSVQQQIFCLDDDHLAQLQRFMGRIQSHQYTLEDVAMLTAFYILSPDKEELSERMKVEEINNNLLKVLEYTLQKTHPEDPFLLAKTLLLLPELHTLDHYHSKSLQTARECYNPNLSPLLEELLPKLTIDTTDKDCASPTL